MSATFSGVGETAVSISSVSATSTEKEDIVYKMIVIVIAAILFIIIVSTFDIIRYIYSYYFSVKISGKKEIVETAAIQLLSTTLFAITALVIGILIIPMFAYLAGKK